MPEIVTEDGCAIHYRLDGPAEAPVVLLTNPLGASLDVWEAQVAPLTARYRVLRHDCRGHGASGVPAGPYSIERLARDVLALLDGLGIASTRFVGVSMGGAIGQWLGAHAGDRLTRLVIACSTAQGGNHAVWNERIALIEAKGMGAVVPGVLDRWFTPEFRAEWPGVVERIGGMLRAAPPKGYAASAAAVRDHDQSAALGGIGVPTLVIGATRDASTPIEQVRALAEAISGARLVELASAHLAPVEQAQAFNRHLSEFLG
ncbi:MAG: 3-oxoadipate enol-lactonase [Geminicoccaceae bacterium]